ncbi:bacillithiol biosynthesis cysteine-adding enzyme BshC [Paraflavitalea sp. CAU 1676]|uniref:bacillithiol biosynthesis cysteine-adding enzyme BshC n=1 Tax=Paraflavitalea sp. CAU 1676 TaxID=3032598 RepID=UPI0023DBEE72|nr:bacillithiol biosynthesis cysteine-adding enzyme BshC [Paraflavitalea sp. CAU 1676]MDF2192654.1 bacillithiol biosynthesis cysteine-adding enzyme BshC [Paraflavitalea sp. CAU 1676]
MNCNTTQLPYVATGSFSKIVTDYLQQSPSIRPFYQYEPTLQGIKDAILQRQQLPQHRGVLTTALKQQYTGIDTHEAVTNNMALLDKENTFTITTAHQPAIFTGHLYFIYKTLHTVRLAAQLKQDLPQYNFVPVFWIGSEDADLDELGNIWLSGDKLVWDTKQTGAVGRMNTKGLETLVHRIEGELSIQPHGKELVQLLKDCYLNSNDVQTATFKLLNALFGEYGLIVLLPDQADLKRIMLPVFEDDLFNQTPSSIVEKTIERLGENYKVQANPRAINLFYLEGGIRERIEKQGEEWVVVGQDIRFTAASLKQELQEHPERFSPNVILRGIYQETLLPNIAFIGGGGETAYWLELKELLAHYKVSYPVLVLRNSFLIVEEKWEEKIEKLGFGIGDFFQTEQQLLTSLVTRHSNGHLKLENELQAAEELYKRLREKAGHIDETLVPHIEALEIKTLKPLQELEKKMLRAEKKKYENEQHQINAIKAALFPAGGLQERVENFLPYYALWGPAFIRCIYNASLALEQEFVIVHQK